MTSMKRENSTLSKFDSSRPILILAPLFEFPIRSGENVLDHHRWLSFSQFVPFVVIVGHNVIVKYQNGKIVSQVLYNNSANGKYTASIKVILKNSHYLVEKFLNAPFQKEASKHLNQTTYGTVVFSFIWTTQLLALQSLVIIPNRLYIIETHNDEVKWYQNLRAASRNPLVKLTAWLSERWIKNFLTSLHDDYLFLHLTQADYQSYFHYFPNHTGIIAPVGTTVIEPNVKTQMPKTPSQTYQLLFIGSLNVQMNLDALIFFRQKFYPHLHQKLDKLLKITVIGKEPTQKVKDLCDKMNWQLFANVTNSELKKHLAQATFTILPFSYTTGAKLKLLDSLAQGVPFLATNVLAHQVQTAVYPCLFSDDPNEWLQRIIDIGPGTISNEHRLALLEFARQYSWDSVTKKLFNDLDTNFYD